MHLWVVLTFDITSLCSVFETISILFFKVQSNQYLNYVKAVSFLHNFWVKRFDFKKYCSYFRWISRIIFLGFSRFISTAKTIIVWILKWEESCGVSTKKNFAHILGESAELFFSRFSRFTSTAIVTFMVWILMRDESCKVSTK